MELIKASSEILQYDKNPLKYIELVARNCYKSEEKITEDSAPKFVKMLFDRGHHVMLEFYPFYFRINTEYSHTLLSINNLPDVDGDLMLYNDPHDPFTQGSCNLRTAIMISKYDGNLSGAIYRSHPELLFFFTRVATAFDHIQCVSVSENTITPFLRYRTGRFICDRGVTHELVRHRKCSFAQESTRYCNYGKTNMQFIIPSWFTDEDIQRCSKFTTDFWSNAQEWHSICENVEESYKLMIKKGWSPQQARSVLPNSLKTEIIIQAKLSEWKHIFVQRCSKAAHPDMQYLMIPFREKLLGSNVDVNLYLIE